MGELVRHEADLAISSLTITYFREKDVEFSVPFMQAGISLMAHKPQTQVNIQELLRNRLINITDCIQAKPVCRI